MAANSVTGRWKCTVGHAPWQQFTAKIIGGDQDDPALAA
jgi:hypothetical protein